MIKGILNGYATKLCLFKFGPDEEMKKIVVNRLKPLFYLSTASIVS